jgi:hypothetical protein
LWSAELEKISTNVVGERDIVFINLDGSGYQMLTSGQGGNLDRSFSLHGRMIIY